MITLNLTATGAEQTILKDYLENNVSEALAEKINSGDRIVKGRKTLINKKTLETFLTYACEEARKLAEKGAKAACVKSDTVFGWAIHYFEENAIEGTLYNEDGTEYKPKPVIKNKTAGTAPASVQATAFQSKPKPQISLFDMMGGQPNEAPEAREDDEQANDETETGGDDDEPDDDGAEVDCKTEPEEKTELTRISETQFVDKDGVVYEYTEQDKELAALLNILGGTAAVR